MSPASCGVLDTTVFIAGENGRSLDQTGLPEEGVISVVTVAELHAGVLAAREVDTAARRLRTLESIACIEVLPIDEAAAMKWAQLRVHLAESGRKINVNDLWIAATAAAHGLPVVTQDNDFDPLDGMAGVRVVKV